MIEITVLDYLKKELDVDVLMEHKPDMSKEYVLIEKIGSSRENYIEHATIALKSVSDSLYGAAKLNEEVKKRMEDIVKLNQISKSKLNSDYDFTDPTTKKYRYQAIYDLVYFD